VRSRLPCAHAEADEECQPQEDGVPDRITEADDLGVVIVAHGDADRRNRQRHRQFRSRGVGRGRVDSHHRDEHCGRGLRATECKREQHDPAYHRRERQQRCAAAPCQDERHRRDHNRTHGGRSAPPAVQCIRLTQQRQGASHGEVHVRDADGSDEWLTDG
jgi:hypothetical protein